MVPVAAEELEEGEAAGACAFARAPTAIEFAIAAPLLFLLLFGIIDFGWAFSQNLDVKHAAREGARLACSPVQPGHAATARRRGADTLWAPGPPARGRQPRRRFSQS